MTKESAKSILGRLVVICLLVCQTSLAQGRRQAPAAARKPGTNPSAGTTTQKTEVLTNEDVVTMVQAGWDSKLITDTINESEVKFDLSPAGMRALATAKVPSAVILAMKAKQARSSGMIESRRTDTKQADVPKEGTSPGEDQSPARPSQGVGSSQGTATASAQKVTLELLRELNSGAVTTGEAIAFAVAEEVVSEGRLLIGKATPATCSIRTLRPKSHWHDADIELDELARTKDLTGREVVIKLDKQSSSAFKAGIKVVGSSAKHVFKGGKDITIPAGARVDGFIMSVGQEKTAAIPATSVQSAGTLPKQTSPSVPQKDQAASSPTVSPSRITRRIFIKASGATVDGQEMRDKELEDSAKDLRGAAVNRHFSVVEKEDDADLKLVVLQREVKQAQPTWWKHKTPRVENTLHAALSYKEQGQWKSVIRLTNSSTVWKEAANHMMSDVERRLQQKP